MSISATALQSILTRIKGYIDSHSSGASNLSDLNDVNLTNISNGQIIKYDSTSQKFINANESGGGASNFADLNDVNFTDLSNGQIPRYNSVTEKFENSDEEVGAKVWADLNNKPFSTIGSGLSVDNDTLSADFKYEITDTEPASIEDGKVVFVYE